MNRWIGILLLNLVFLGCEAQETDSVDAGYYLDLANVNNETIQIATLTPPESLEDKLLRYGQECYNDSTLKKGHKKIKCLMRNGWDGKSSCYDVFPEHWWNGYIHRKPTFKGFIEWLKENK